MKLSNNKTLIEMKIEVGKVIQDKMNSLELEEAEGEALLSTVINDLVASMLYTIEEEKIGKMLDKMLENIKQKISHMRKLGEKEITRRAKNNVAIINLDEQI